MRLNFPEDPISESPHSTARNAVAKVTTSERPPSPLTPPGDALEWQISPILLHKACPWLGGCLPSLEMEFRHLSEFDLLSGGPRTEIPGTPQKQSGPSAAVKVRLRPLPIPNQEALQALPARKMLSRNGPLFYCLLGVFMISDFPNVLSCRTRQALQNGLKSSAQDGVHAQQKKLKPCLGSCPW